MYILLFLILQNIFISHCLEYSNSIFAPTENYSGSNFSSKYYQNSIVIVTSSNSSDEADILSANCTFAFENFMGAVVNFTRCTVKYARPIHICMECVKDFREMEKTYVDLKKQDSDCSNYFFASDQLGIIDVVYNSAKSLWDKSYCEDCFDHINGTKNFFHTFSELMNCIEESNSSAFLSPNNTCVKCQAFFANLTEIYNAFVLSKNVYNPGICMDIVDTMNISRGTWDKYKCLVGFDSNIGILNVLTTLTVGVSPVLFYLMSKNISRLEDIKLVRPKRKFTTITPPET